MKKILALIMVLALVMGLAVTASAVDVIIPGDTTGGTSTGDTMRAYKVFDATISGDAYAYTIDSGNPFFSIIQDSGYFTLDQIGNTTTYNVTPNANFANEEAAIDLAGKLNNQSLRPATPYIEATYNAANDTYTFTGLDLGYYLIQDWFGAKIVDTVTAGENGTLTLDRKTDMPTLKKEIIKNGTAVTTADVAIGEVITFRITVSLPKDVSPVAFVIHDQMDEGLEFIEITKNDFYAQRVEEPDGDCCNMHLWIRDWASAANYIGSSGVIEYTAKLKADADIGVDYTNKAWMVYQNFTSVESAVTVHTNGFTLNKVDGQGNDLDGATFVLSKSETAPEQETAVMTNFIPFTENSGVLTPTASGNTDSEQRAKAYFTAGSVEIVGLASGTYYLHETRAPEGYNKLTAPVVIVIAEDGTVTMDGETAVDNVVEVENKSGSELPSTGGIGTTLFYVIGTLMMTGAAVLMITKKRMSV